MQIVNKFDRMTKRTSGLLRRHVTYETIPLQSQSSTQAVATHAGGAGGSSSDNRDSTSDYRRYDDADDGRGDGKRTRMQ